MFSASRRIRTDIPKLLESPALPMSYGGVRNYHITSSPDYSILVEGMCYRSTEEEAERQEDEPQERDKTGDTGDR